MGLSASLTQGFSGGGSQNTGWSTSQNGSSSYSNSWTDAMSARQWSAMMADIAWERDMEAMQAQMNFNSEEAEKQREWQTQMANTIYTRSVKNMREAGINPILAANMGLSGAAVGSGATASLGGTPSAPLAQSFMDSYSASNSISNGWSQSENMGNSWQSSENGLVTALTALGNMVGNALEHVTSGANIELTLNGLQNWTNEEIRKEQRQKTEQAITNGDYGSRDYPHEPGKYNGTYVGTNLKMADTVKKFGETLKNLIK